MSRKPASVASARSAVRRPAPAKGGTRLRKLAAAITKALPGWKIVETPVPVAGKPEDEFVKIDQGPSLADLKRKFLPDDVQDGEQFDADDGRVPVRIRPEQGGEAKTADIGPDGRVTIVQG